MFYAKIKTEAPITVYELVAVVTVKIEQLYCDVDFDSELNRFPIILN